MTDLSELVALEVGGEAVSLAEVLRLAKFTQSLGFLHDAVRAALVRQGAAEHGLGVSDEELQREADDFRLARELHDSEATEAWLAAHSLTYEDWESLLEHAVLERKLRDLLTEPRVEQHFAEHRLLLDTAVVSRLVTRDEDLARELRAQVVEEGVDFHALAREFSTDEATRPAGGYAGVVRREDLEAAVEPAVFGAAAGRVVGPFKTDDGWTLYKVEEVRRASLDAATREAVKSSLFAEWLDERRRKASISVPLLEVSEAGEETDAAFDPPPAARAEAARL